MLPKLSLFLLALVLLILPATQLAAQTLATDPVLMAAEDPAAKEKVGFFEWQFDKLGQTFFPRFLIDLGSVILLIGFIYYRTYGKKDFFFTFFMFNITIFFITYLLNKVELSMGAAFGLFAVFSLLRYRTEDISAKDMTYLFTVIALGLVSAANKGTLMEVVLINGLIIASAFLLEGNWIIKTEMSKSIQYDNIEKIHPDRENELMDDLRQRTGLDIHKITVGRVDYLRDTANVKVYYYEKPRKK